MYQLYWYQKKKNEKLNLNKDIQIKLKYQLLWET